jgi:KUP system potassium uptake protein
VKGAAVFLHGAAGDVPVALLHNLKHNRILHETVVMLTVVTQRVPYVASSSRIEVAPLGQGFWRVIGNYGFMEQPNVPELLTLTTPHGLTVSPSETSFYLSRETVIASSKPGMALWRERLFGVMLRNATPISAFFGLKPNRVVELGAQVEI